MCFYNFFKNTIFLKNIIFLLFCSIFIIAIIESKIDSNVLKTILIFLNFFFVFAVTYLLKQLSSKQPLVFVLWIIFEHLFIVFFLYFPIFSYIFKLLFDKDTKLTRSKLIITDFYINKTLQSNLTNKKNKFEHGVYKNDLFYDYNLEHDELINNINRIYKFGVAVFFVNCNLCLFKKYYNFAFQNMKLNFVLILFYSVFPFFSVTLLYFFLLNKILNLFDYYLLTSWIFTIFYLFISLWYYFLLFHGLKNNFKFAFKHFCFDKQKNQKETPVFVSMFNFDFTNQPVNKELETSISTNLTNSNLNTKKNIFVFYFQCFISSLTLISIFVGFEIYCHKLK